MRQAARDRARLAWWALVFTPVTILVHELGHFAVAVAAGLPATLHPTRVSGGPVEGVHAGWLVALEAGAGPFLTVAMGLLAAWFVRNGRGRLWATAFGFAAISRLAVAGAWLALQPVLLGLGTAGRGSPNFDEYNLARALEVSPYLTSAGAVLVLVVLASILLARIEPRGQRWLALLAMAVAVIAANVLWPALAPDTLLRYA